MIDIAKGVIAGGWALLVGWLLPTAINVTIFCVFVLPSLQNKQFNSKSIKGAVPDTWILIGVTILAGLILNAIQRQLYGILEGYTLWPQWASKWGHDKQEGRRRKLQTRLEKIQDKLAKEKIAWRKVNTTLDRMSAYPDDPKQIAPTRLGNAIRQFEGYAYDRFQLDSQTLWYELSATAPAEVTRQADVARGPVDLFVCLIYGHIMVALAAIGAIFAGCPEGWILGIVSAALVVLSRFWYVIAYTAAGEWAATQQALANLGRKPLADALGLKLPDNLDDERTMWRRVTYFVQNPYEQDVEYFDAFRPAGDDNPEEGSVIESAGKISKRRLRQWLAMRLGGEADK
ncbi:hypothetical protein ABZ281_11350 [Streptomyces sp. NPDC006265]|uniref:hypothetical protein n=1 Tax=Streptomyces sp. NPDC006265 TaxID=3156740 RepID=UPI0033A1F7C2